MTLESYNPSPIQIRPIIGKLLYQAGLFEYSVPLSIEQQKSIRGAMVCSSRLWSGNNPMKRMWMGQYDAKNPTAPDCASRDGVSGSRPSMTLKEAMEEHEFSMNQHAANVQNKRVFGDCAKCFFGSFKSAGVHFGVPRDGKQCGDYNLILMIMSATPDLDFPLPVILQVPSSGANLFDQMVIMATEKRQYPEEFFWEIFPTGGGRSQKQLKASIIGPLSDRGKALVSVSFEPMKAQLDKSISAFLGGRALDDDSDEEESTEADENPI